MYTAIRWGLIGNKLPWLKLRKSGNKDNKIGASEGVEDLVDVKWENGDRHTNHDWKLEKKSLDIARKLEGNLTEQIFPNG